MIHIKNPAVCQSCNVLSCSFLKTGLTRHDFGKLTSETTVCPTQILSEGPYEGALKSGFIDKDQSKICIDCGLCVSNCQYDNLELVNNQFDINEGMFATLTSPQLKATVSSYLGFLFKFAANTNRNKSLLFDGLTISETERKSFVEMDWNDDSLECTRRILGDILTYRKPEACYLGLVVLQHLPSYGNRDVYNLLKKIHSFPNTKDISIHIISIPILRWLCLHMPNKRFEVENIAFNPLKESKDEYIGRINAMLPEDCQIP